MSDRCPQDGGFIGDAGCTHPNHAHSERVQKIVNGAKNPAMIRAEDATAALEEGFYVENPNSQRVGFGKRLLGHIENDHDSQKDINGRKERLVYAVATVVSPDKIEQNHKGLEGRTAYTKAFDDFGVLAISTAEGEDIEEVFNIVPKRSLRKRARDFLKRFAAPRKKQTAAPSESIPQNAPTAQGGKE